MRLAEAVEDKAGRLDWIGLGCADTVDGGEGSIVDAGRPGLDRCGEGIGEGRDLMGTSFGAVRTKQGSITELVR